MLDSSKVNLPADLDPNPEETSGGMYPSGTEGQVHAWTCQDSQLIAAPGLRNFLPLPVLGSSDQDFGEGCPATNSQPEPDVRGRVPLKGTPAKPGPPNVRFHVNWWEGTPSLVVLKKHQTEHRCSVWGVLKNPGDTHSKFLGLGGNWGNQCPAK